MKNIFKIFLRVLVWSGLSLIVLVKYLTLFVGVSFWFFSLAFILMTGLFFFKWQIKWVYGAVLILIFSCFVFKLPAHDCGCNYFPSFIRNCMIKNKECKCLGIKRMDRKQNIYCVGKMIGWK